MADEAAKKDEDVALAADGEENALLGGDEGMPEFTSGDENDDDAPAPETGLHALGQLGTAVLVVGALVLIFLAVSITAGWIFR